MRCIFCGIDPNPVVLVAILDAEGRLKQFSCLECALKNGLYCTTHDRPHLGFHDGTHACIECVEEDAASHESLGAALNVRINVEFPPAEVERIDDYLEGVEFATEGRIDRSLARIVALIARRSGHGFEEAVEAVMRGKSAAPFAEGTLPEFDKEA